MLILESQLEILIFILLILCVIFLITVINYFVGDAKREAKQALLKRLGMRGPASNLHLPNRNSPSQYDSYGNVVASNPFADPPNSSPNFGSYERSHIHQFSPSANWNQKQNWGRNMPAQNVRGVHHSSGSGSSPQHQPIPSARSQYSPLSSQQSGMPAFQMSPGSQNLHTGNQFRDQSFRQNSPQSQLSPGSYQSQYPGSQGFNPAVSQQMSPSYTAQPIHHSQSNSSQPSMPYSPPVTFSPSQNQRAPNASRFFPGNSGQFQQLRGIYSQTGQRFNMPPYSRPDEMSAPSSVMSVAHQMSGIQSHDLTGTNQNPTQISSEVYKVKSNCSLRDSYQENKTGINSAQQNVSSLPMYTAQRISAIDSSQSQNSLENIHGLEHHCSDFTQNRPNQAEHSKKIVANLLEQVNRKGNVGRGQTYGTQDSLHSPSHHSSQITSVDSHRDVRRFLSSTLVQRQQRSGSTGEFNSPNPGQNDFSGLHSSPFGRQLILEGSGYTDAMDSSPKAAQQLSPRTPTGDSGLQSPGSAGSKQSEPFVGPVTKYFNQRKLMYEQISPPVTPISTCCSDVSKKPLSTSSPSSGFSEPQISPLQRLLLDNSDLPVSKTDPRQRSPSRSSLSSLSSIGSEKPNNQTQHDLFHPVNRNNQDQSKLFSLLSSMKTDGESKKDARNVNDNMQQSQSDSQQDLFADSLLSDIGSVENTTADSLTSLFSDDLPVNAGSRQQGMETGVGQAQNDALTTTLNEDFASLSSLESFVGSVRNESAEFGVNFNKTTSNERSFEAVLPNRSVTHGEHKGSQAAPVPCSQQNTDTSRSMCQQLSCPPSMSLSSMPVHGQERLPLPIHQNKDQGQSPQDDQRKVPQVFHQSPSRNYNLTDWPQYQVPTNISKPGRGGGQRRRGRPPGRKGLAFPMETFGIVQKKRRGRPKKNGDNFTLPSSFRQSGNVHSQGSQFSQHSQNQYTVPPNVDIPPNVDLSQNININMPYYPNQPQSQSFSQMLEGDSSDLLAEFTDDSGTMPCQGSQFGVNSGMMQGLQPSGNQFLNEMSLNKNMLGSGEQFPNDNNCVQQNFSSSISHNQTHLQHTSESLKPHQTVGMVQGFQGQQYSFDQQQEQHFQQHPLDNQRQLSTISLTEAMQISEPDTNFSPTLSNFNCEELSQIVPVQSFDGQTDVMNSPVSEHFQSRELMNQVTTPSRKTNIQALMKRKQHLQHDGSLNKTPKDVASIMELIRYRPQSGYTPKTSASYKFKFKVPTPVFKRLKFRVKKTSSEPDSHQLDFVRMHPKDARKYSLLKIGREIIPLKKLSEAVIDEIKEKLKLGESVDGIPPPIRQVLVADVPQNSSLIEDLLSADSPVNNEMIGTADVEEEFSRSFSHGMTSAEERFMMKRQNKSLYKDNKANSMFRGRSIANIPHLKKYRAGFPYFGKGNVGRGASNTKVRANNKSLKPEYEDDEKIVLKDVSLNDASDGVLTPIKSRTPVAGRSPAHYGGGVTLPEIENQEKMMLESKLKDLEYDLDLNQSGNSQMFHDVLIGEKELQQKAEFENAEEDLNNQDQKEKRKIEKSKLEESESMHVDTNDFSKSVFSEKELTESKTEGTVRISIHESEKSSVSDPGVLNETIVSAVKIGLSEKSAGEKNDDDNHENINLRDSLGKLKKQFEKQLTNGLNGHKTNANTCSVMVGYDETDGARRSRSSSRESHLATSQRSSRRNSVVLSSMSGDEEKCFWSVGSVKRSQSSDGSDSYKSDPKRVKMYKSATNGSSSAGSRKSSRSSSFDQDRRKKKYKSKKKQKKTYRYDSDSDGIPGVDYIVVNRFKGRKELRVVVDKLKLVSEENDLYDKKINGFNSKVKSENLVKSEEKYEEGNNNVKSSTSKSFTGFSAEFEKFLANQSVPAKIICESDSDTEDTEFPAGLKHENAIENIEEVQGSKDELIISKSGLNASKGSKFDGTEDFSRIKGTADFEDFRDTKEDNSRKDEVEKDITRTDTVRKKSDGSSGTYEGEFLSLSLKTASGSVLFKQDGINRNVSFLTGLRDFSSSSDEEQCEKQLQDGTKKLKKKPGKSDGKKKKSSKSIHDGSVFCSKSRKKKPKSKSRPSKLMCSLSALHDATLEKLTSFQVLSDMETCNSSSSQSPAKSRDMSDLDSPVRWQPRVKTPDFELYLDRTDDHISPFEDTMYKLAYLSPMSSDSNTGSPPQPLSPKELRKLDGTVEHPSEKITEHNEKKMTMSDILKSMQAESELSRETDVNSAKFAETPGTPNKIAVAKTEALTLKDIKSLCLTEKCNEDIKNTNEEREEKRVDSPPPDLGPPVLMSENEKLEDCSPPPQLSPNRNESESDSEPSVISGSDLSSFEKIRNAPPFLTPCRSPRVSLSPRYASPRCAHASDASEIGDYFSLPVERDSGTRAGRSPGACSSSGSINVIHSEEFSDISDENESDNESGSKKRNRFGKPKYTDSPTMPCLSPRICTDKGMPSKRNSDFDDKEKKLREIKIFEEKLRKSDKEKVTGQEELKTGQKCVRKADENRNNIFELLSNRSPVFLNHSLDQTRTTADINRFLERNSSSNISRVRGSVRNGFTYEVNDQKNSLTKHVYGDGNNRTFDSSIRIDGVKKFAQNEILFQGSSLNHVAHKIGGQEDRQFKIDAYEHSDSSRNGELKVAHSSEDRQYKIDAYKHSDISRNGELIRSSSQNDFLQQCKNFRNWKRFQEASMDLNRVALERTLPPYRNISSPKNLFENFDWNRSASRQNDRGAYSGDLFESSSESTSRHSLPSFSRSLSDNGRTEYNIIRSDKFNDSIVRSVQNLTNREKNNHTSYSDIPFLEFGGGEGKRKSKGNVNKQDTGTGALSRDTVPFNHKNYDSLNGFNGDRDSDKSQGHQKFGSSELVSGVQVITPHNGPPSLESIIESANQHGLAAFPQSGAFYSNYGDVPEKPRYFGIDLA